MSRRTPDGPPPPPTVVRVRLRYAKRGRLRFASHRDFARAFERALRRAGVPMAYSGGFTPHPKISYVGAAATGVASEAEYVEIGLAEPVDVQRLRAELNASLPAGLDIVDAVESRGGSLAERIDTSVWEVRLPGVPVETARAALSAFLGREAVPVQRLTKDGRRTLDARAVVRAARIEDTGRDRACAILRLVVRHVTPAVRPDDVLAGLQAVADLVPPVPPEVTRRAQGLLLDDGRIADPLAPDRPTASAADGGPPGSTPRVAGAVGAARMQPHR